LGVVADSGEQKLITGGAPARGWHPSADPGSKDLITGGCGWLRVESGPDPLIAGGGNRGRRKLRASGNHGRRRSRPAGIVAEILDLESGLISTQLNICGLICNLYVE
jgi:hypothetical protein